MITQANKILRWIIVILFIIIAVESIIMKFGNCDKFKGELDGKKVFVQDVVEIYFEKCLHNFKQIPVLNLSIGNLSS